MSLKQEIQALLGLSASDLESASSEADDSTVVNIEEAIAKREQIDAILERPYRELLLSNGYDPDEDFIFMSTSMADGLGISDKTIPSTMKSRVRILKHLEGDNLFLLTSTEELRKLPEDGRRIIMPGDR